MKHETQPPTAPEEFSNPPAGKKPPQKMDHILFLTVILMILLGVLIFCLLSLTPQEESKSARDIRANMNDGDASVRKSAVEHADQLSPDISLPLLIEKIKKDPATGVRLQALRTLKELNLDATFNLIIHWYGAETDPLMREEMVECLSLMGAPAQPALEAIVRETADPALLVRAVNGLFAIERVNKPEFSYNSEAVSLLLLDKWERADDATRLSMARLLRLTCVEKLAGEILALIKKEQNQEVRRMLMSILSQYTRDDLYPEIIAYIKRPEMSAEARAEALPMLAEYPQAKDYLGGILTDPKATDREKISAVVSLGWFNTKPYKNDLMKICEDTKASEYLRARAMETLGYSGDRSLAPWMLEQYRAPSSGNLYRYGILWGLFSLQDPTALPIFLDILNDPKADIQTYTVALICVTKLGAIKEVEQELPAIFKKEASPVRRAQLIKCMGFTQSPVMAECLVPLLKDPKTTPLHVLAAVYALGEIRHEPAAPLIIEKLAKTADGELVMACSYALSRINTPSAWKSLADLLKSDLPFTRATIRGILETRSGLRVTGNYDGTPEERERIANAWAKLLENGVQQKKVPSKEGVDLNGLPTPTAGNVPNASNASGPADLKALQHDFLNEKQTDRKIDAFKRLADRFPEESFNVLLEQWDTLEPDLRLAGIQTMGDKKVTKALDFVLKLAETSAEEILASSAFVTAGQLGARELAPRLIADFDQAKSGTVRKGIVCALGQVGGPQSGLFLEKILEDAKQTADLRCAAAQGLAKAAYVQSRLLLLNIVETPQTPSNLRGAAVRAISELGGQAYILRLIDTFKLAQTEEEKRDFLACFIKIADKRAASIFKEIINSTPAQLALFEVACGGLTDLDKSTDTGRYYLDLLKQGKQQQPHVALLEKQLLKIDAPDFAPVLIDNLALLSPATAVNVLGLVAKSKNRELLPKVANHLTAVDMELRRAALKALENISGHQISGSVDTPEAALTLKVHWSEYLKNIKP